VVEIRKRSGIEGAHVDFDPIGLRVAPGTTVRWVVEANVHTATTYHPANDGHPLRIPQRAEPWDSGYLVEPGEAFEVTLTAEGVYDYFCAPHEVAGMVGRIIVGRPGGPGTGPSGRGRTTRSTSGVPERAADHGRGDRPTLESPGPYARPWADGRDLEHGKVIGGDAAAGCEAC
jgi:plastocyanin